MAAENTRKYFEIEYLGGLACFIALESQGRVTVWSPPKNRGGRILFKTTPHPSAKWGSYGREVPT